MRILCFGQTKAATGSDWVNWPLPEPVRCDVLWGQLAQTYPQLNSLGVNIRLARNQEFASPETLFSDADEAALIPPVSGG